MTFGPGGLKSIFDKELGRELLNTGKFLGFEVFTMQSVGSGAGEFGRVQQPTKGGEHPGAPVAPAVARPGGRATIVGDTTRPTGWCRIRGRFGGPAVDIAHELAVDGALEPLGQRRPTGARPISDRPHDQLPPRDPRGSVAQDPGLGASVGPRHWSGRVTAPPGWPRSDSPSSLVRPPWAACRRGR